MEQHLTRGPRVAGRQFGPYAVCTSFVTWPRVSQHLFHFATEYNVTGYIDTKHTGQAYSVGLSPIQLWPTVTRKARSSSFSATGLVRASCTRYTRLLQPKKASETTWSVPATQGADEGSGQSTPLRECCEVATTAQVRHRLRQLHVQLLVQPQTHARHKYSFPVDCARRLWLVLRSREVEVRVGEPGFQGQATTV